MPDNRIAKVLQALPQLTVFGIGIYRPPGGFQPEEYAQKFAKDQALLLQSTEMFARVCDWLLPIPRTKNPSISSYELKHICENSLPRGGYVYNGVFIAAAIDMGFPWKVQFGGPNVLFGVAKKGIHMAKKQGGQG